MNNYEYIKENYKIISDNVAKAAQGRSVRIMAVTKTVPVEKINYALSVGIDLIGENRVQEFLEKREFYVNSNENVKKYEIHFIGGLQNNKVKYIIDKISLIQSADSGKLLAEINKRALAHELVMDVLIEVNIGSEYSKNGVHPDGLFELICEAEQLTGVRLRGLMAIPPINAAEKIYADMQRLFYDSKTRVKDTDSFDTLSMGMSDDYVTAIKHGANIIRIGSALFGSR